MPETITKTEADQALVLIIERVFRKTSDGDEVLKDLRGWLGAQGMVLTGDGVKRLRKRTGRR